MRKRRSRKSPFSRFLLNGALARVCALFGGCRRGQDINPPASAPVKPVLAWEREARSNNGKTKQFLSTAILKQTGGDIASKLQEKTKRGETINNNETVKQRKPREARENRTQFLQKILNNHPAAPNIMQKVTLRANIGSQSHEKCSQNAPRWCPRHSKVPQRQPKVAPKCRQGAPKASEEPPRDPQRHPKELQNRAWSPQGDPQKTKGRKRTGLEREPSPRGKMSIFPRENIESEIHFFRDFS